MALNHNKRERAKNVLSLLKKRIFSIPAISTVIDANIREKSSIDATVTEKSIRQEFGANDICSS